MKKSILLVILFFSLFVCSCGTANNAEEPNQSKISKADVVEFLMSDCPGCALVDYVDYSSPESSNQYVLTQNMDDNTYQLSGGRNYKIKHVMNSQNRDNAVDVRMERDLYEILGSGDEHLLLTHNYNIEIENDAHIDLLAPQIESCHRIPFCYYSGMTLRWNSLNNGGKMLLEINTTGLAIGDNLPHGEAVYHECVIDDSGSFVIPDAMFEGIVDRALVDVTLTRANVFKVEENGQLVDWEDVDWDDVLSADDIETLTSQVYMFASISRVNFAMILVRQLPSEN